MPAPLAGAQAVVSVDEAVARARRGALAGTRLLLGITGPPGSGKSTLADRLAVELGDDAAVVGMDGFHLAQAELARLGRAERKGAPDTFDAAGYVALLRRLRYPGEHDVYAPVFRRDLEEPIGSALPVAGAVPVVLTEGNYLLVREGAWAGVAELIDETWYVDTPRDLRLQRLIARHIAYGKSPAAARAWATGPDERNAQLVESTRGRAHVVVRVG